jgi:hypothetical protein
MSLTTAVNRKDLAQQVPALMGAYPLLDWHVHDFSATPKLIVDLWVRHEPERRAQVVFDPKREMFTSNVRSHESIHTDEASSDGAGSLRVAIDHTGPALMGPTEFSVTYAAGVVVRSSMSVDFDDVCFWSYTRYHGRRLRALLRGDLRTKTLNDSWSRVEPPTRPALGRDPG